MPERLTSTPTQKVQERLVFLSELGRILTDEGEASVATLQRVARLSVSSFADFCIIDLVQEEGGYERVASTARDPAFQSTMEALRRFPPAPGSAGPQLQVARTGTPELWPSMDPVNLELITRGPEHLALVRSLPLSTVLIVPLAWHGRFLGTIAFVGGPSHGAFDEDDVRTAEEAARRVAAAVENARLIRESVAAERRARFLAEAGTILAGSLDYRRTLEAIVKLAVPTLADWCAVDMLAEDGSIQRLAIHHSDPKKLELAAEVARQYPVDPNSPRGMPLVLRTGAADWERYIPEALLRLAALDERHFEILKDVGLRSYISVPIAARGRVLGALSLVFAESGRLFTEADLALAQDLARQAGLAVDNALLYGEAQEAVRVRDEFLSIASHELKTPLTPLQLRLHALERELQNPDPARLAQHIEVFRRQVRKLGGLVDGLLDVSRITAGRLELQREEVDLVPLAQEVIARHEQEAAKVGCTLTLTAPDRLVGQWDRFRLDQVLTNLVSNAMKYGAGNAVDVRLAGVTPEAASIEVQDRGIGIAHADLGRIFERFERAVPARNFGGLGLGLYITRRIVEALGGEISVVSEPGQGSTFTVQLPRTTSD